MSFFEELKRRNVFRVGIAYGVASWIILQVADLVLENIGSPEWVIQTLMFLVGLGFIAALIIAWAYELTPEGIKKEADVVRDDSVTQHTAKKLDYITLVAVLALLGFMVLDRFVFERTAEPAPAGSDSSAEVVQATSESETTTAVVNEKSIAVLPFVDMSPEGDQAYFADGIAEEILNVLVKTHSLKVAGRTSSFQFRNREEDLRLIGEQLGVENILEGSIRKAGNRLRITAQLVKANDGFHLWSETYDRELDDVFAIQDEIAKAITQALAIELNLADTSASLAPVLTSNMGAYDKYLEARALLAQRIEFPRIFNLLDEATALDPEFAEGWATLAQAHALSFYYNVSEREDAVDIAMQFARQAIELDPNLSEAHSALADALRDRSFWNEAWDSYTKALELNPDNVEAHLQFAQLLSRVGHHQDAFEHGAAAARLDPLSWITQLYHGFSQYQAGLKDEAFKTLGKAEVLGSFSRSLPVRFKVRMALSEGRKDIARRSANSFIDNTNDGNKSEDLYFQEMVRYLDEPEKARKYLHQIFEEALETSSVEPVLFWAMYYGEQDLAERLLEAALGSRTRDDIHVTGRIDGTWILFKPVYPLFSSPTMKQLFIHNGLEPYWRKHGWPDFCRPIDDDDFECGVEGGQ